MSETKTDPKNTIAFQGSPGAHSDLASRKAQPYMYTLPCFSFEEVFETVESGKALYGMIPIENSRAGRVAEIPSLLQNTSLNIIGEYVHKVSHHLMAPEGTKLEDIKEVFSHPQALMQCRDTLNALGIEAKTFSDTAAAAEYIVKEGKPGQAALASDLAAELYGLEVIKDNMQDSDNNRTLFITIAQEPAEIEPTEENVLTSLIFTTRNIPAGLYKAMGGFATNGVNILKLESFLQDFDSGTAQFFTTLHGHPEQHSVQLAMEELGFFTTKVHILGSYPADSSRFGSES
jgi:prephenate dehydratase